MGGFLGIGGSSAKTDRGNQLAGTQGLWNIFNTALPQFQPQEAAGQQRQSTVDQRQNAAQSDINTAGDFFRKLLTAGRTDTAARSAPAVNAALASSDTARRQEAATGTGRTGGTAELNRESGARTSEGINNIINQNLQTGQDTASRGLTTTAGESISNAGVGVSNAGLSLNNAMSLLGLSGNAAQSIMNNATYSRPQSQQIHDEAAAGYGKALGTILQAFMAA